MSSVDVLLNKLNVACTEHLPRYQEARVMGLNLQAGHVERSQYAYLLPTPQELTDHKCQSTRQPRLRHFHRHCGRSSIKAQLRHLTRTHSQYDRWYQGLIPRSSLLCVAAYITLKRLVARAIFNPGNPECSIFRLCTVARVDCDLEAARGTGDSVCCIAQRTLPWSLLEHRQRPGISLRTAGSNVAPVRSTLHQSCHLSAASANAIHQCVAADRIGIGIMPGRRR